MRFLLHPPTQIAASSSRTGATRSRVRLRGALGFLLALNGAMLFFFLRSPGQSPAAWQEELARLEARHKGTQNKVQELRELVGKAQAATQNGQQFARENFLPRSSAFSTMLENLEKLASQNHLQPGDIGYRLGDQANQLGWVDVAVSLAVEGEYPDMVRFINQLEQSKLFWIIQNLDVSGSTGARLRLNLHTATYLLPS